ncbi:hypothetical protein QYM36_017443 [Artemia franciscana]|uniref:Reverse transcriptase domain-containing protein n=1 Tax=Artemia franciscana TaxID=6661 RepID=A0AA88HE82_ARTSF|nr:hypothetical protein QYM36_017443 [Artemia franciscana]
MPGRSTVEQIFTMRQLVEKTREFQQKAYVAFMDFKAAFDSVDQQSLWLILKTTGLPATESKKRKRVEESQEQQENRLAAKERKTAQLDENPPGQRESKHIKTENDTDDDWVGDFDLDKVINAYQILVKKTKKIVEREISNCKMTEEPTMATPEEAARNECIQAEVAELVKRYVSGSRSERLQV